jgi:hypothetical protein
MHQDELDKQEIALYGLKPDVKNQDSFLDFNANNTSISLDQEQFSVSTNSVVRENKKVK